MKDEIKKQKRKACKQFLKEVAEINRTVIAAGKEIGIDVKALPTTGDTLYGIMLLLEHKDLSVSDAHVLLKQAEGILEKASKVSL